MLTPRNINRATISCVLACALAAPATSSAQDDRVSPQTTGLQDMRSPDARDAAPSSSLAGTVSTPSQDQGNTISAQDLRTPDARDAASGRGTFTAPDVTVVKLPQPAPTHADGGVDWADAGIGAGFLLGVIALALASATAIAHRRRRRPRAASAA